MERIRVGIVGCGEVAQIIHLPSLYQLADQYQVTAVCDVSAKVLNSVGDLWGVSLRFQNYQELVQHPDVDAVLVTNPHVYHTEVTLAAIEAGKHVLVEKPMSISLQEADQIIAAQRQAGVVVQVGYMRRYAPAFLEACRRVPELGKIGLARVHDVIGSNALIIRQTSRVIRGNDISDSLKAEMRNLQNQQVQQALGGEVLPGIRRAYLLMLGLSSHDLSAMRELLGMPHGVLYASWQDNADWNEEYDNSIGRYLTAAFDYGSFVCQFETGIDNIPRFDGHIQVYGSDAVLKIQYDTPYVRNLPIHLSVTESNVQGGVTQQTILPAWGDPFVIEWQEFYKNVQEGREPKTSASDYRKDLELFLAMINLINSTGEKS
jgi:predicted dehydrogenase